MRKLALFVTDLAVVVVSAIAAVLLRDEFVLNFPKLWAIAPNLALSAAFAAFIFPAFGISRRIWHYSSLTDFTRIALAALIVEVLSVLALYGTGAISVVGRSVPVLHLMLMTGAMVGLRLCSREYHRWRRQRREGHVAVPNSGHGQSALVAGLGANPETYIRALLDATPRSLTIAGLLSEKPKDVGRLLFGLPVLGHIGEADKVADDLTVHGVYITKILAPEHMAISSRLPVERIAQIALAQAPSGLSGALETDGPQSLRLTAGDVFGGQRRWFWFAKRALDVVLSFTLLFALAPVIAIVAALVGSAFGFPVLFWQMRPGRGGTPFRLYKFRTMLPARDGHGQRRPDAARMTRVGDFLRRTRLDELPQFYNILKGDMSFVGPRPLIQIEQSPEYAARLLVRPGLTGWAQVKGGRDISFEDKAALDVWYAKNASPARDLEIMFRTVPMVLFGEQVNREAIRAAWKELERSGIYRPSPATMASRPSHAMAAD